MALIHRIYSSTAHLSFRESEIPPLLTHIRAKNQARGVTGMLLFIEGSFFQVLEGEAATVDEIYAAISQDPRHERVTQIIREPIAQRSFDEWSMGFASASRAEVTEAVGANDFFANGSCLDRIDSGRAKKLLLAFRAGRWRTEHTGMHRARVRAE